MDTSILTSQSFLHMMQVLFWGCLITGAVLIFSYFTGNLSHPLVRAMKRLSKLRLNCLSLSSRIDASGKVLQDDKSITKTLRLIMRRKKSVVTSINVYIYDDNKKNLNQSMVTKSLDTIDAKCKDALSSIMEGDASRIVDDMNECAEISLDLYRKFQEIIKKESHDKLFDL